MTNEQLHRFFSGQRLRCLRIKQMEREAGLPEKTLGHFIHGRRELSAAHINKLIPVIISLTVNEL